MLQPHGAFMGLKYESAKQLAEERYFDRRDPKMFTEVNDWILAAMITYLGFGFHKEEEVWDATSAALKYMSHFADLGTAPISGAEVAGVKLIPVELSDDQRAASIQGV